MTKYAQNVITKVVNENYYNIILIPFIGINQIFLDKYNQTKYKWVIKISEVTYFFKM